MSLPKLSKLADSPCNSKYFFACLKMSHRQGNNLCSKNLSLADCRVRMRTGIKTERLCWDPSTAHPHELHAGRDWLWETQHRLPWDQPGNWWERGRNEVWKISVVEAFYETSGTGLHLLHGPCLDKPLAQSSTLIPTFLEYLQASGQNLWLLNRGLLRGEG